MRLGAKSVWQGDSRVSDVPCITGASDIHTVAVEPAVLHQYVAHVDADTEFQASVQEMKKVEPDVTADLMVDMLKSQPIPLQSPERVLADLRKEGLP